MGDGRTPLLKKEKDLEESTRRGLEEEKVRGKEARVRDGALGAEKACKKAAGIDLRETQEGIATIILPEEEAAPEPTGKTRRELRAVRE